MTTDVNRNVELSFRLNKKQAEFYRSQRKFKAFIGGIGSGKSFMGCLEALLYALYHPGAVIMIVAPSYRIMRDSTQRSFMEICPPEAIAQVKDAKHELVLIAQDQRTGRVGTSEVLFRSADNPDDLRGPSLAMVVLDEASKMPKQTWQIIIGRLRQPGFEHRALALTTPKGRNWLWDVFVKNATSETDLVTCPTEVNRQNLPPGFIESLQEQYVGVFKEQELMGQFVTFEGRVYEGFDQIKHVAPAGTGFERESFARVIAGVDWGFTNPMGVVVVGLDGDGRAYVVDEVYKKRLVPEAVVEEVAFINKVWSPDAFFCDPSEPQNIQMLVNAGIPARPAFNEVMPGIMKVASYMEVPGDGRPRLVISRSCPNLISELDQYVYAEDKDGKTIKEVPLKVNDHLCLARGTMISTVRGQVPIESIKGGDWVLTRAGPRRVLCSRWTGIMQPVITASFSHGQRLKGTSDHPVFTQRGIAVPMDRLEKGEYVWAEKFRAPRISRDDHDRPMLAAKVNNRGAWLDFVNRSDLQVGPVGSSDVVRFIRKIESGEADVFNLEIEGSPEYFANGILVHNCDALRYALYSSDKVIPATKEQRQDPNFLSFGGQNFW
jgi:phage terminase large subunit-like protein